MGFGNKWKEWMKACVFNSSMSVLVNGCVTKDFKVERGLRQGNLLSPFLFVMAMEGLTRLMNKAVAIWEYSGFHLNEEVQSVFFNLLMILSSLEMVDWRIYGG